MDVNAGTQLHIFLVSLAAGGALGLLFDIFRISRKIVKTGSAATAAEDIIFLVIAALVLFATAYATNSGELRWYEFAGVFSGAALYFLTLSKLILLIGVKTVQILIKIILFLLKIVIFPIALIYKLLRKPLSIVFWYCKGGANKLGGAIKIRKAKLAIGLKNAKTAFHKK